MPIISFRHHSARPESQDSWASFKATSSFDTNEIVTSSLNPLAFAIYIEAALECDYGILRFSYDGGIGWSRFTNNTIVYAVKVLNGEKVYVYDTDGTCIKLPRTL